MSLTRSVLPARRRWLTLRSFLLCGALTGCAAGMLAPVPPSQPPLVIARGIPLSVWWTPTLTEDVNGCAPRWIRPATFCAGWADIQYDGCEWRCVERKAVQQ